MKWRPMQRQDLDAVVDIASQVHPLFPEERDTFLNKLALHPGGALLLEHAGHPAGYCFALPWHGLQPPALDTLIEDISPVADALYLHDLALLPAARGTGAGTAAVDLLLTRAAQLLLERCFLVAVNRSVPYWSRMGFTVIDTSELQAKLASYGNEARLMVRPALHRPVPHCAKEFKSIHSG
jgi:ribosomal protein S18 acetylase RimI-like enzyme